MITISQMCSFVKLPTMSERQQQLTPLLATPTTTTTTSHQDVVFSLQQQQPVSAVRRNLFGPVDHEQNQNFIRKEMNKLQTLDADRWNFDFVNELPREGKLKWERLNPNIEEDNVPQAYQMPLLEARLRRNQANIIGNQTTIVEALQSPSTCSRLHEFKKLSPSTSSNTVRHPKAIGNQIPPNSPLITKPIAVRPAVCTKVTACTATTPSVTVPEQTDATNTTTAAAFNLAERDSSDALTVSISRPAINNDNTTNNNNNKSKKSSTRQTFITEHMAIRKKRSFSAISLSKKLADRPNISPSSSPSSEEEQPLCKRSRTSS